MSVLSESDRRVVSDAIARARAPRVRMTRTQALAPVRRRPVRDKTVGAADRAPTRPLAFQGICSFCGSPARIGLIVCDAHEDLIALDAATSAVVTHNTNGTRRSTYPGSAAGASEETS